MNLYKAAIAAAVLLGVLFAAGCAQQQQIESTQPINFTVRVWDMEQQDYSDTKVAGNKGENLYELLQDSNYPMQAKEYPYGVFIESMKGLTPSQNQYIAIYVNGTYAQTGITEIYPDSNDLIEFMPDLLDGAAIVPEPS